MIERVFASLQACPVRYSSQSHNEKLPMLRSGQMVQISKRSLETVVTVRYVPGEIFDATSCLSFMLGAIELLLLLRFPSRS